MLCKDIFWKVAFWFHTNQLCSFAQVLSDQCSTVGWFNITFNSLTLARSNPENCGHGLSKPAVEDISVSVPCDYRYVSYGLSNGLLELWKGIANIGLSYEISDLITEELEISINSSLIAEWNKSFLFFTYILKFYVTEAILCLLWLIAIYFHVSPIF